MGCYELPVAMDIFRGRYRKGFANSAPIMVNQPLPYRFHLSIVEIDQ
jgi:hypothetical protein